MKKNLKHKRKTGLSSLFILLLGFGLFTGCEKELPEAGSIVDETPPEAGFSYSATDDDSNLVIKFTNLSSSATTYMWDFGDEGNTPHDSVLTATEPEYTYPEYGTYTVTLVSSDKLGVVSSVSQDIEVVEGAFQPAIKEASFEEGTLAGETGNGKDTWRNSDLGGVIQISSDPVLTGVQAAKLTGSVGDQRIGYQLVTVEAETNYNLNFYYTMKDDQTGFLTVSVLSGAVTTHEAAVAATIGSITVNDQSDPNTYVRSGVTFNSGSSTEIAIYFFNEGSVESRLDDFTIDIAAEGAVPPSSAYTYEQSATNFLEYTFINSSTNAVSYAWDFGDGNTSTDESPVHEYAEANTYSVSLTTKNEIGTTAVFSSDIDIQAPVTADFTFEEDAGNYQTYSFTDASEGAVSYMWDFGDGFQSNLQSPTHTYTKDGAYTVTLTAYSVTGLTSVHTEQLAISAGAIIPAITNGNFDDSSSGWKPSECTGCSTSAFNGSSDGSWYSYDGILGTEKTPGAKYTSSTSAGEYKSSDTRYAYQALTVTPNTTYVLEYEYAIKSDTKDGDDNDIIEPAGGRRVMGEILDGHFDDGADAAAQSEAGDVLATSQGTVAEGKFSDTVGETVTVEFTSNDSGEIAIWLWAVTPVDAWFDNVKVYPKD